MIKCWHWQRGKRAHSQDLSLEAQSLRARGPKSPGPPQLKVCLFCLVSQICGFHSSTKNIEKSLLNFFHYPSLTITFTKYNNLSINLISFIALAEPGLTKLANGSPAPFWQLSCSIIPFSFCNPGSSWHGFVSRHYLMAQWIMLKRFT